MIKYILIAILNFFDYAITVYWTGIHGIDAEINPLMRWALSEPWAFAVIKLLLFPMLLLYMWKKNHHDSAWIALDMSIVVTLMNCRTVFGA
jgi:Na+(H+)/acetate symporter ActP